MAILTYGTGESLVDLGPYVRTMDYSITPEFDRSGLDLLWHRIDIGVEGILTPRYFSSNMGVVGEQGRPGSGRRGDRVGIALGRMADLLAVPRQRLVYGIGSDQSIVSPLTDAATGSTLDCDADGKGPLPGPFRVVQVNGDGSVLFRWSISTTRNGCSRFLLSNRWGQTASIDQHGYTTRTTRGRAEFRQDFLSWRAVKADSFRQFLIVPCPEDMRRCSVQVTAQEDGRVVEYTVQDREVTYAAGNGVTLVEGNATAGVDYPHKSLKTALEKLAGQGRGLLAAIAVPQGLGLWMAGQAWNAPSTIWSNIVPDPKANVVVRVHGRNGVDHEALSRVGLRTVLDQFGGAERIFAPGADRLVDAFTKFPASCYVTKSLGSEDHPWVEVRAEFLLFNLSTMQVMFSQGLAWPHNMLNLLPPTPAELAARGLVGPGPGPTQLPLSGNTRGTWIGAIVGQVLKDSVCDLPLADEVGNYTEAGALA